MPESEHLPLRSVKTSALLATAGTLLLLAGAHRVAAWDFAIGALISLFSLGSLVVLIPRLFRPRGSKSGGALAAFLLLSKLPIFGAGVLLVLSIHGFSPLFAVAGMGLAPAVITLKTLGAMVSQSQPARAALALAAE